MEKRRNVDPELEQTIENGFEDGIFQVPVVSVAVEFEDGDQILMIEQDMIQLIFDFF